MVFTDRSALSNPGPTGSGAVIYLDGHEANSILLKKGVNPISNNYTGELVGIQIALSPTLLRTKTYKTEQSIYSQTVRLQLFQFSTMISLNIR